MFGNRKYVFRCSLESKDVFLSIKSRQVNDEEQRPKKNNISIAPWSKLESFSSFQDNTKTEQAKTTIECL